MPFSVRFAGASRTRTPSRRPSRSRPSRPSTSRATGSATTASTSVEQCWKAGTKVTVTLNLDGVEGRPGVYGKQAKTVTFTIGRSQVSTVDAKTHKMVVKRDGKVIKTIPITTGKPGYDTWNGQMVISEQLRVTRMNGGSGSLAASTTSRTCPTPSD